MRTRLETNSRPEKVAAALAAIAVVGSALAVGSVDTPVLVVVAAVLAGSCVLAWHSSTSWVPRRSASILLAVGVLLTAFTLIQVVPLPVGVVRALSPHTADVWSRCLHPLGEEGPSWVTLSLDPTATRVEVLKGTSYVLAFLAMLAISRTAGGARRLELVIFSSSVIIALVAAVHFGLGVDRVYGFYRPKTGVGAIAPFMNTNQLAAYVNIGLLLAVASLVSSEPFAPRPLLGAVVVLLGAAEIWFASRGAVGSAALGIALIVMLQPRWRRRRAIVTAIPLVVALAGAVLSVLGAAAEAREGLADTDFSKLRIAGRVFTALVPAYPVFGVGRGAFESTFPEFRTGTGFLVWTHPENVLAQWSAEWGMPVSIAALAGLAYALRPNRIALRRNPPIGPWTVLVAVMLHNLVDFSMEAPAMIIALAGCAAIVVAGDANKGESERRLSWARRPSLVAIAGAGAFAVAVVLVATRGTELLDDREASRVAAQAERRQDPEVFRSQIRGAILGHPAEPYFYFLGASRAAMTGGNGFVAWADQTLERAPVYPPIHLLLARRLRRSNASQARLEYRLYAEQNGGQPLDVVEVEGLVASPDDARELAPPGEAGVELLESLAARLEKRLPATVVGIDAEIEAREPGTVPPAARAARAALLDLTDSPWCEHVQDQCAEAAIAAAAVVVARAPGSCDGYVVHARVLAYRGSMADALALLRDAATRVSQHRDCDLARADIAMTAGLEDETTLAIDAVAHAPCEVEVQCTESILLAAGLEDERGSYGRAFRYYKRALELAPDDEKLATQVASRASRNGLHVEAATLYGDLAARHPANPDYGRLAQEERSAALRAH